MQNIRKPAVAGSFYPADKIELSTEIDKFLNNAVESENRVPRILLVPHAGYDYSGQVAAYGYKLLQGENIDNVVILASSHNYPINGVIADCSNSWETPLGEVELNQELISKLGIKKDSEPFVPEHSLEVQLPFLQKGLPAGFKVVPILVGDSDSAEMQKTAALLAKNIDENTLVIVSSDMAHYPSGGDADKCDHETIGSILTGDVNKFDAKIAELEKKDVPNAVTFMCGKPAVEFGMIVAEKIRAGDIRLLNYANSGDVTGNTSRVVGYSAIGFFEKDNDTKIKKQKLLEITRESVESYVKNRTIPNFDKYSDLDEKSGVFVTLNINGTLRGCIGLIESNQPLYKTVPEMAVAAAVQDPRFSPVTVTDLPKLEYEVSVLSPMKRIKDASEIKLGTHGVKVQQGGRSGVFLPQVAEETGWTLDEFMGHLCQEKAGLPADCWHDPATEIYTFTAQVFSE